MMYTAHFQKFDLCDWFCDPGSHLWPFYRRYCKFIGIHIVSSL